MSVVPRRSEGEELPVIGKNVTSRVHHVIVVKMGSRCKRLVDLATKSQCQQEHSIAENQNGLVSNERFKKTTKYGSESVFTMRREVDNEYPKPAKRICRESSTSSISSTSSSSSSSSSSGPSIIEDTDDSVKDPDYQCKENVCIESSDDSWDMCASFVPSSNTTNMVEHVDMIHTNSNLIRTVNNEMISNATNEPDLIGTENEPSTTMPDDTPTKKGKKRPRQESNWKKNIAKALRNSGKSYQSPKTKKNIPERQLKPPCKENCTFKCRSNITETERQELLKQYWNLGAIEKQWTFLANSIELVVPKHRYVKISSDGNVAPTRHNNNAFFLTVSGKKIRVCKTFFKNTFCINNRPIETALKKKNTDTNISLMKDQRGCHGNHAKVDESIRKEAKAFIEAIPKIDSHYTRATSKRHFIDGSKTITDIHRDYVEQCKAQNKPFATYVTFYRIFTTEFNISFFIPKKDLCDVCEAYKNSTDEEKEANKENYETHIKEKQLSRLEKDTDKNSKDTIVAVYDLEAVFQCPKGEISVFYYKSKLNVLNHTVYNIKTNVAECYVWDESNANRGVNEIGTCVFNYLTKISETGTDLNVVFYSDNCAGQQKNKFMISMYLYAVQNLPNIKSITHKYLIKGHTQNEGDSAHSQIEREVKRQLRSGPMYTPDAFVGAIKAARKRSTPFQVHEMCYEDFYDWKSLCTQMNFTLQKDEDNKPVKLMGAKVIRVQKDTPNAIFFKDSYAKNEFQKAIVIKKRRDAIIELKKAYTMKPGISDRKKADLMDLVNKNLIPRFHRPFYEAL